MSEDRTRITFTLPIELSAESPAGSADEEPVLEIVRKCLPDLDPKVQVEVSRADRGVELTFEPVALQFLALERMLSELEGSGYTQVQARVWIDSVGETTLHTLVEGELLSFESLEALQRSTSGAATQTMPSAKLQKLIDGAVSYLAIRFARPEKPLAKHLAKVRSKARGLFEEATIEGSGSSWLDGLATVVYRGYIDTDLVTPMVRDNYLVEDLFEILGSVGAEDIRLSLHHEELPATCHAFLEGGKPVCRFFHQGRYVRGFVTPSTDGVVRGGEEATDPDVQKFNRLFDRLNDGLKLVHASEGKTIDECTESLVARAETQGFAVLPRLWRIGVENALVVVDFDQGKAISITFPQKAMAMEWIARRIHDHRDGALASGDYGLYDAVADRFYRLQADFTWDEQLDAA